MSCYRPSYPNAKDSKGIYYLHPNSFSLRMSLVDSWRRILIREPNNYESVFPCMVTTEVLTKSGHILEFKEELFKLEGLDLYLRPETTQSIFPVIKDLVNELKFRGPFGSLGIGHIGKAFRLEKTTREGAYRKREFEQMELEVIHNPLQQLDLLEYYKKKVEELFRVLDISYQLKEPSQKPHYSKLTLDIIHKTKTSRELELGCINLRGQHDIKSYLGPKSIYEVLEISLGLDRILELYNDGDKSKEL